jgi:polysaccharide export outer membrane protein
VPGILFAVLCAVLAPPTMPAGPARATPSPPAAGTVQVRITLPGDGPSPIAVSFEGGTLSLELPRGASYPLDFEGETEGLVRGAELTPLENDRVRLALRATALLDRIDYEPGAIVLTFRRRTAVLATQDEATAQYKLGPEDKIQIMINGQPEMTQVTVVSGSGTITAPMVGEVTAGGMTVRELTARLTDLLARDYLVDPRVDVQVLEYKSQWVMVSGEVRNPGRVALRGNATLKDVLADAGGLTEKAGEEIVVSKAASGSESRQEVKIPRVAFERGETNPALGLGDIVNVRPVTYMYIWGEVKYPGRVQLERGMTLLRAIAIAGGLTEWADRTDVQVMYEKSERPGRSFNLRKIEKEKEPDPELRGGEVIIVKRRFL